MIAKRFWITTLILFFSSLLIYYYYPIQKIPTGTVIDQIIVHKSKHELEAYSNNKLIVVYKITIAKKPVGAKEYEGDLKTPEGIYTINTKNPNSGYYKNLGISYPNTNDIAHAKQLGKPTGGDIKIHGLKNGQAYIGKFLRWKDWTNGCIALTNEEVEELYNHTVISATIEIKL